ncbi:MAG TPA: ABC transporter substrate-binding protein [Candidatus Limnocylindrales bacterium]
MATDPFLARIDELSGAYLAGRLGRRQFLQRLLAMGLTLPAAGAILAACSSAGSSPSAAASSGASSGGAGGMDALVTAAKGEGKLYLTGIPPEWANYQGMFDLWQQKYGIPIDGVKTEGEYSSGQELDSIKNTGKPDAGDVGFVFGAQAKAQGLLMNYKHAEWADVPDNLKDTDGAWCATYYGAEAFVINTDAVKIDIKDWDDLLDPSLKNAVGIDGDPNKANDSFMAVWSAAHAKGGGEDDIGPGVDFFNGLQRAGNLTPARCNQANMLNGEVKVGIKWDYLGLADRDKANGSPNFKVVIPKSASLAGPYVSILAAKAPHPNAAKLWNELVYSDDGQLAFLKGYAHPIRYDVLNKAGKIPSDLAAKLPSADSYANVKFVTDSTKIDAAKAKLKSLWQIVVNQ